MEIRRFGVGNRRREGPAGTQGVDGQPIHSDGHGVIAELAFRPNAAIAPHSNPNLCYFVVIEGGGFVRVGEERARVAAGEAVVWPPDVIHAAWTEQTPMRAIVIEFALPPTQPAVLAISAPADAAEPATPGAGAEPAPAGPAPLPAAPLPAAPLPADGELIVEPRRPEPDRESPEREPW
jgi:quercetin dioxygenase-like cupin family protein